MPSEISNYTPAATVLFPVYNAERYLRAAIDSVLTQSHREFELLLLNDGSSDRSVEIIESYAAKDPRCRVHSWKNRGLVATLNAGVELANTEFIIRMDADDVSRPQRFEKQIAFLRQNHEHVAVGARVMFIDPEGLPIAEVLNGCTHEEISHSLLARQFAIAHPSTTIRRSALEAIGGYRSEYPHAEDLDLFLRLAEIGYLANLPETLLDYRQHIRSISYQNTALQFESAIKAIKDACARRSIECKIDELTTPPGHARTESDIHRLWAWWALHAGNVDTARKHAVRAFRDNPIKTENWRLLACALRGY
jgi:glycosyltransferase involved in cell wall biosynthesis